jgi:hypothetical protein
MAFTADFRISFWQYDNYPTGSDGYSIDEIVVYDPTLPACTPYASGRVAGWVYDDNTGLPLEGVLVEADSGESTTTWPDGF